MFVPMTTGSFAFDFVKALRQEDVLEIDDLPFGVRQFYAHRRFSGDGRLDADGLSAHGERDVVMEVHDLADLDARRQNDFVARDDRPGTHGHDLALDPEVHERFFEDRRVPLDPLFVNQAREERRLGQEWTGTAPHRA
jgi:hypothetical protein